MVVVRMMVEIGYGDDGGDGGSENALILLTFDTNQK